MNLTRIPKSIVPFGSKSDDNSDSNSLTDTINADTDVVTAIKSMDKSDKVELKRQLFSAAAAGALSVLERRLQESQLSTEQSSSEASTIEIGSDSEAESDSGSSSRLLTLPRLLLVGLLAGAGYVLMKRRRGEDEETNDSTFAEGSSGTGDDSDTAASDVDISTPDVTSEEEADEQMTEESSDEKTEDTDLVDSGTGDSDPVVETVEEGESEDAEPGEVVASEDVVDRAAEDADTEGDTEDETEDER